MQINVNNDFTTDGPFSQAAINSFVADENTAIQILDSTFKNNISVTIDIGFGSFNGSILNDQTISEGDVNIADCFLMSYPTLKSDLQTFGAPGFYNSANLPANVGQANFYVSSSVGAIFGLAANQVDGYVGIGTGFTPGAQRVSAFLHEICHALGRVPENITRGDNYFSELDLWRFTAPETRLFNGTNPDHTFSYFSIDGGNTQICQWGQTSDSADFRNGNPFTNDPFNETVGNLGQLTTADIECMEALGFTGANLPPPAATTAVMIMTQPSTGNYEIYDIGNNAVLAAYPLAQAGSPWQAVDVGGFDGSDTSDLLLRNGSTGAFELFDVVGNNAIGPVQMGAVGTDWSVLGFGDFSGNSGETDMLMRQAGTAKMEVYDISNNQITGAASIGAVGPEWQFLGVGDFSSNANETDLLMRDVNNGALEVYNISHNALVSAASMGAVGLEWQFVGVGDFSGNVGETDMLMRDVNNGALEVYNVHNDQIVSAQGMGAVGLEWSQVGIGNFSGHPGETDMIMRDSNNGAFEIYDISHDSVVSASPIGAVGTDWQTVGIAPYPAAAAAIASSGSSALTGGETANLQAGATSPASAVNDQGPLFGPAGASPGGPPSPGSWFGNPGGSAGAGWLQDVLDNGSGFAASTVPMGTAMTYEGNNPLPAFAGSLLHQA